MTAPSSVSSDTLSEGLPSDEEIQFLELLGILILKWRMIAGVTLAVGIIVAIYSLWVTPVFTATTSFVHATPGSTSGAQGLAGLAGQFGISIGNANNGSPRVDAVILESREITDQVLVSMFHVPTSTPVDSATLLDILEIEGETLAVRLDRGQKRLREMRNVSVDNVIGVVRLAVESPSPALSADVANRFIELLKEFTARSRSELAGDRSHFIEGRMADAERALRLAEDQLRLFYESNRVWESPELIVEEGRLRREVTLRQELHLTLSRSFEQARIEEVDDVVEIAIIDRASPPLLRSAPRRKRMVMIAMLLSGLLATGLVLVRSHFVVDP
jgi:uncharacterized protein involved in exopolysaccharide biosynthesis